ncbi:putative methyltransferase-domain-containing protein [Syncephalastrum racemosum]|uniref:Putative methyltransferase-domain-containing protein n=1 Tax=Syncephalastrum racemosum TaxID=13706 RepID=A0A1X2HED6_SYNRA|nr:putative methyltransferase-domain-containing protein [Syncephalastrum racemosum]
MPLKLMRFGDSAVEPAKTGSVHVVDAQKTTGTGIAHRSLQRYLTPLYVSPPSPPASDDTDDEDMDLFYQPLHRHSTLHRIVLARNFRTTIARNKWYRLDLQVVNELGLQLLGDKKKQCCMQVTCDVLFASSNNNDDDDGDDTDGRSMPVEVRPLSFDGWDDIMPEVAGFNGSGHGGLEFCLQGSDQYPTKTKYFFLRVTPLCDAKQTVEALPLVLGPLTLTDDDKGDDDWLDERNKATLNRTYAASYLNRFANHRLQFNLIIREGWSLGTPGKMWDSALVVSEMMAKRLIRTPRVYDRCHIVDLSAGTGCAGILLATLCRELDPAHRTTITLTDLPSALGIIRENKDLNLGTRVDPRLRIEALQWGNKQQHRAIVGTHPADIILASDVLYEPKCFADLVTTLEDMSTFGRTVIFLGYKRRGLNDEEEALFFRLAELKFHINVITEHGMLNANNAVKWEQKHGPMVRNWAGQDGKGWLGRYAQECATAKGLSSHSQSGVVIYRLVLKAPGK